MNELRPVGWDYAPCYPERLSEEEIRELLRPCLLKRFSKEALFVGALAAGTALSASPASAQDGLPALPKAGVNTQTDAALRADVNRLLAEILGPQRANLANVPFSPTKVLEPNPLVKYPQRHRIHFGTGVRFNRLDVDAARAATEKLFMLYGIKLARNVSVKGNGYEFVADGYNEKLQIGFELVTTAEQYARPGTQVQEAVRLDTNETKHLGAAVKDGGQRMFVAHAAPFTTIGAGRPPMRYYLDSIVDYLNWVHGDRRIDKAAVLRNTSAPGAK